LPPSELECGVYRAAHLFHGLIERKAMHFLIVDHSPLRQLSHAALATQGSGLSLAIGSFFVG
jgi:hypothetical protein